MNIRLPPILMFTRGFLGQRTHSHFRLSATPGQRAPARTCLQGRPQFFVGRGRRTHHANPMVNSPGFLVGGCQPALNVEKIITLLGGVGPTPFNKLGFTCRRSCMIQDMLVDGRVEPACVKRLATFSACLWLSEGDGTNMEELCHLLAPNSIVFSPVESVGKLCPNKLRRLKLD